MNAPTILASPISTTLSTNETNLFPRSFTLENANTFGSDLTIVDVSARPLYHVAHHYTFRSGKPNVVLQTTPDKSSPVLASAVLHTVSNNIEINLGGKLHIKIEQSGILRNVWSFDFTLPNNQVEHFEWKRSSREKIAALDGKSRGLKLVRTGTKEVVAVYAGAKLSFRGKGKFGFTSQDALGSSFELMAVISMLAITEDTRRKRNNAAAVSGAS